MHVAGEESYTRSFEMELGEEGGGGGKTKGGGGAKCDTIFRIVKAQ